MLSVAELPGLETRRCERLDYERPRVLVGPRTRNGHARRTQVYTTRNIYRGPGVAGGYVWHSVQYGRCARWTERHRQADTSKLQQPNRPAPPDPALRDPPETCVASGAGGAGAFEESSDVSQSPTQYPPRQGNHSPHRHTSLLMPRMYCGQ